MKGFDQTCFMARAAARRHDVGGQLSASTAVMLGPGETGDVEPSFLEVENTLTGDYPPTPLLQALKIVRRGSASNCHGSCTDRDKRHPAVGGGAALCVWSTQNK